MTGPSRVPALSRILKPFLAAAQGASDRRAVLTPATRVIVQVLGPGQPFGIYLRDADGGPLRRAAAGDGQEDARLHLPDQLVEAAHGAGPGTLRIALPGAQGEPAGMLLFPAAFGITRVVRGRLDVVARVLSLALSEIDGRRAGQILARARQQILVFDLLDLRMLEANTRARDALALRGQDMGGLRLPDLLDGYGEKLLRDLLTPLMLGRTQELRIEGTVCARDGRSFPGEFLFHLLPGPPRAGVVQIVDISARKLVEGQLHAAVEALPDAFVLFDRDDRLVICNERYREMYNASAPAIRPGARFEDILRYGLERGQYVEGKGREEAWLAERLAAHRAAGQPLEQHLEDGTWVRVLESPTGDGGRVGFRIDISEIKHQQAQLERERAHAEAANAAKTAFLAMISHEIRTPMNGVIGMAELLADSGLAPEQASWAATILESSNLLLNLINDLLDVSKIEAGKLQLEQRPFDPVDVLASVVALHRPVADRNGLQLSLEIVQGGVGMRMGDAHRFRQVLNNLLSNAVKFTDQGSVRLTLQAVEGDMLVLGVADTGIGMSPAQLERIFEDFVQADSSTTRRYGGSGLGMGITRRLVEAMAGRLDVVSEPGHGTTVTVRLPMPCADMPAAADAAQQAGYATVPEAPGEGQLERLKGLRCLVTDDNATNRRVLSAYLQRLGGIVTLTESGQEAIDAFAPGRFDVILMDISMPEMDGATALTHLRRIEDAALSGAHTPALAVTAHVLPALVAEFLQAGFAGYVAKPIRRDDLSRALLGVLP